MISLSRLSITGLISSHTPIIVIKDIADAHSIIYDNERLNKPRYLSRLIESINSNEVHKVKEPYTKADLRLIAGFVNKHIQWKTKPLIDAFNYLLEYANLNKLYSVHKHINYGLQTVENPFNLNSSVIYGMCRINQIETRPDSSLEEMVSNLTLLFNIRNNTLNTAIKNSITLSISDGSCEGYQLINILNQIDPSRVSNIIDLYKTNRLSDNINNRTITYDELKTASIRIKAEDNKRRPRTHVEAIVMGALYHKIDLSKVSNPLVEYQELCKHPHFPYDRELARRLQLSNGYSERLENPRLNEVFNSELPMEMYDEEDLTNLCIQEGYKLDDIIHESSYTILQTAYLLPTFLHGKQGIIINRENTFLDELDDLEYDNVIVYGIRNNNMTFMTYSELTETFKSLKRFQSPINNTIFTDISINKLYYISGLDKRDRESNECYRERLELAQEIDRVRLYQKTNKQQILTFLDIYERCSILGRNKIKDVLTNLLDCAMYMRGWNGKGSYPLTSEETNVDYDEQPKVEIRVIESIVKLEESIANIITYDSNLYNAVKELPLIFYHNRTGELLPSTNEEEGLTILERIHIVKGGDGNDNIKSCIRMSSNRFAASAYYYMGLIGLPLPFKIENMSHIL